MSSPIQPGSLQATPGSKPKAWDVAFSSSGESEHAMNGSTHRQTVLISNPEGLHMRLAMAFASLAESFPCKMTVSLGEKKADGKSILDLISLIALPGSELTLEANGQDAKAAIDALVELVSKWSEGDKSDPPSPRKG